MRTVIPNSDTPTPAPAVTPADLGLSAFKDGMDNALRGLGALGGAPAAPAKAAYIPAPRYESVAEGRADLRKGMQGPAVEKTARQLESLGLDCGTPADKYGPKMTAAVESFQKSEGLDPTGRVDQKTLQALETKALAHELATNTDVQKLSPEHQAKMQAALAKDPRNAELAHDLEALAGNAEFKNLNSGTASQVLDRVSGNSAERHDLTALATQPGFGQLNAAHQTQALEAFDAGAAAGDSAAATRDLQALSGSASFRHLSDDDKTRVLGSMKTFADRPDDRAAIAGVASSAGFDALPPGEKTALLRTMTSDDPVYGQGSRAALKTVVESPEFKAKDAAGQAADLKKVMRDQSFLPRATTAADGTFGAPGKRPAYTVSSVTTDAAGLKHYSVTVEGKTYPVVQKPPGAGVKQTSPDDVGKALASVPKGQREQIVQVDIEPNLDPESAYMRSNSTGHIWVYPTPNAAPFPSEDFMASAMIHETGHITSGKAWGDDVNGPKWDAWKKAMKSDGLSSSSYAHTTDGQPKTAAGGAPYADDYAESVLLYARVKGTPDEAKMRALFPERFRILDEMCR